MPEETPAPHEPPERWQDPDEGRGPTGSGAQAEAAGGAGGAGTGDGGGHGDGSDRSDGDNGDRTVADAGDRTVANAGTDAVANDDAAAGTGGAEAPRPRAPRLRRWALGRPGATLVGVLVGALLATGVVAWRAGELPFLAREVCWGSLSPETVDGLLPDRDIRSDELPLGRPLSLDSDGNRAECSVRGYKGDESRGEVVARVRHLERYAGRDAREWQREFLSSRMAPLPGQITGMVSSTRAWAALPGVCTGGSDGDGPPRVVTLATGEAEPVDTGPGEEREERAAMARAVVELTNGVMAESDCAGRYAAQDGGGLAPLPEREGLDDDEDGRIDGKKLCGIEAARIPAWVHKWAVGDARLMQGVRPGASRKGLAHSCDVGRDFRRDGVRLTTIEDPGLAGVVEPLARKGSVPLRGDGYGAVADDMAVFMATCQTGRVAFMARDVDPHTKEPSQARALLPPYVAAEAKRIGCGAITVEPVPAQAR